MPTRTLHGWTPATGIDGQVVRLWKGTGGTFAPAGTIPLENDDDSCPVEIETGFTYKAELRSKLEAEESDGFLTIEFTHNGDKGSEEGTGGGNPEIAPPTGSLMVSNP